MRLFSRKASKEKAQHPSADEALGLFLFDQVNEALAAERVLARAGHEVSLVAPPPHLRAGCDLACAVPRVEYPGAARALEEAHVHVRDWVDDMEGSAKLGEMVTTVDFGPWLMVRAGNMKITIEKETGLIVNTSGGGCPDIPYLNLALVGRSLAEASRPRELGYTLCGLMLDRAFTEAAKLVGGEGA